MSPSFFHHTISSFWAFSSDVTSFFSDSLGRGQVASHRDLSFSGLIMNLPCRTIVCLYVFHPIEICPSLSSSWTSHAEAWCVYMSFLPTSKLQKTEAESLNLVCPVSWLTPLKCLVNKFWMTLASETRLGLGSSRLPGASITEVDIPIFLLVALQSKAWHWDYRFNNVKVILRIIHKQNKVFHIVGLLFRFPFPFRTLWQC